MDSRNTNFRIILALTAVPQDIGLHGTSLKVTVGNSTKTIPITNKEATPMDFTGVNPGAKIEFGLEDVEGFMFGYSELRIPNIAFEKNETEINENLRFYLIDKEKDSFVANVYAIFLNKGMFKEKPREKSPLAKSRNSPLRNASSRSPTTSPGKKSPARTKAQQEAKQQEKNFQAYLNRLVDNHSTQLKNLVDEHNSLNDYIQMNKMQNNLPSNFGDESLENYTPVKLHNDSMLNKSSYNSRAVNEMVDAHNRSVSDFINTSQNQTQAHVAQFGGRDEPMLKLNSQILRDLSPIAGGRSVSPIGGRDGRDVSPLAGGGRDGREGRDVSPLAGGGRDGRSYLNETSGTPGKRQTSSSPIQSPLKKAAAGLDRKNSVGSPFDSPMKRKSQLVGDASFETTARREVPDAAYFKAQITNLNNVIVTQNARLADVDVLRRENEDLMNALQRSEGARKALQESIQETTEELKHANRELEKQVAGQLLDRESQLKKNSELQSIVQELTNGLAAAETSLQERDDMIDQQVLKLNELEELRSRNKKLQDSLVATDKQRTRDQEAYTNSLGQIEQSLLETRKIVENLSLEKKKLLTELHKTQEELSLERAAHQATQNELLITKKRLENAESYKQVIASLEAQRDQLNAQLADLRANLVQSNTLVQEAHDKLAVRTHQFETKEKEFARETSTIREKLGTTEARAERLSKEVGEQKLNVVKLNSTVSSLEQLVCVKEDVSRQLEAAEKQLGQVLDDRKILRGNLEVMAEKQEQTNNRLLDVERQANNMRAALEEKDEQIEHLTQTVIQLREGQDMYVPAKGDFIDNAIADFINGSRDSRLRLLFIRETEGVYVFGTKRIYVKLEGGKILLRVGGGFLLIDEFIDQYAPLEFEKLARNDPIRRLSQNIAVNKSLVGKCVNQMEKSKNQVYEYRGDASGMKLLGGSPVGRHNSVNY